MKKYLVMILLIATLFVSGCEPITEAGKQKKIERQNDEVIALVIENNDYDGARELVDKYYDEQDENRRSLYEAIETYERIKYTADSIKISNVYAKTCME